MRRLLFLGAALAVLLWTAPASARPGGGSCTGKCWPATSDCYGCGFSAFFGAVCVSGQSGGVCYCEEYACPTAGLAQEKVSLQVGQPAEPKVLRARLLAPRV